MKKFVFKQRIFILATLRQKVWQNMMNEIPAKIALHARVAGALLWDDNDESNSTMVMCCLLQIIIMFVMSFLIGLEVVHTIIILLLDLFDI